MLVLTRKSGERILVGDDIEIEVLEVRGGVARIGIHAPKHVRVLRGELVAEVAEQNTVSTTVDRDQLPFLGAVQAAPVTRPNR